MKPYTIEKERPIRSSPVSASLLQNLQLLPAWNFQNGPYVYIYQPEFSVFQDYG